MTREAAPRIGTYPLEATHSSLQTIAYMEAAPIDPTIDGGAGLTVTPFTATVGAVHETRVKEYSPKRPFGPLTPAQFSLYIALNDLIPDSYPSKESLSIARAREICFMGGRALRAVPHVSPMNTVTP